MEHNSGWWHSASPAGLRNPSGTMTWGEADRAWLKAKGRSVRTVLDSVDLMKNNQRTRRRKAGVAAFVVAAAGLGIAALMVLTSGGGPADSSALASSDDSPTEQTQDAAETDANAGPVLAVGGEISTAGNPAPNLASAASGSGGPGGATVTGGGNVDIPSNPFDNEQPPLNGGGGTGGGGGGTGGGAQAPISGSVGLGNPLGGGSLLNIGGSAEGLLSLSGDVDGSGAGDLGLGDLLPVEDMLPGTGNLLDVNVSGDPA
jgi:hypothetical protein